MPTSVYFVQNSRMVRPNSDDSQQKDDFSAENEANRSPKWKVK